MQIHRLQGYIQNIFLIEDQGGLLLLDGCSRADVDQVCQFITATLQRPLSDLRLVVVTHMHPDHAGGAHALRRRSGARIACHPHAPGWYRGLAGRTAHAIDVLLTWWVAGRLGKRKSHIWYNPVLAPDSILLDGQALPGFPDWQVLYTPGHTDHDLSLWHVPTQQLYVADLIVRVRRQLTAPYPICHPNQYRQSLQRVQALQPVTLYFAHVPEQAGAAVPFTALIEQAPRHPKNHWYSMRNRIARKLGGRVTHH